MQFYLEILTPEKQFFSGDVESLIFNTPSGEMGIMAEHVPCVAAIVPSTIRLLSDGVWKSAAMSGGFAQIKHNAVVVLADTVEWPEDIDVARATEAKNRAEERLQKKLSEAEYIRTQVALQRALSRLKTVGSNDNK